MTLKHTGLVAGLGLSLMAPGLAAAHGDDDDDDRDEHLHHEGCGHHGLATLQVRNTFDGKGEVWIDRRVVGTVGGDQTMTFLVEPGVHDVRVERPDTNYPLVQTRLHLYTGSTTVLPVQAPAGTLRVSNGGEVALKIQADDATVWISPGSAAQLTVETGNVKVLASIKEPRGEWKALEKTVWVEPGIQASEVMRPDPTVIVVTNRDRTPMRMLVDGVDAGTVGAYDTRRVWVRPGSTQVVLIDNAGRVRTSTRVYVSRGKEVKLVVEPTWQAVNTVVTVDRPGGPLRPGEPCPYR
jgi:hypothetical protein